MAKTKFQIRDETFGLALYEAESAREALLDFVADHARGEARPDVVSQDDGSAEVVYAGVRYSAVPAGGAVDARDLIVDYGLRNKEELRFVVRNRGTSAAVFQSDSKPEVIAEAQRLKGWEPIDGDEQTYGRQMVEHNGESER